jgi:hypothetical protein
MRYEQKKPSGCMPCAPTTCNPSLLCQNTFQAFQFPLFSQSSIPSNIIRQAWPCDIHHSYIKRLHALTMVKKLAKQPTMAPEKQPAGIDKKPTMAPEKQPVTANDKLVKEKPRTAEARFADILADASNAYREASGQSLDEFMDPPLRSVGDLTAQLDKRNLGFSQYRNKRRTLIDIVSAVMTPVELVASMAAGAASEAFSPAEGIFSAVLWLIGVANNVSSSYDRIIELFRQLKVCQLLILKMIAIRAAWQRCTDVD